MIVRESISNFERGKDSKSSLGVGLAADPWRLCDFIVKALRKRGYNVEEPDREFEKSARFTVIFNIHFSLKDLDYRGKTSAMSSLCLMYYKPGHSRFKFELNYGVAHKDIPLIKSDNWEEVLDFILKMSKKEFRSLFLKDPY